MGLTQAQQDWRAHLCRLVENVLSSCNSHTAAAHFNLLQGNDSNRGPSTQVSNPLEQGAAVWPLLIYIPSEAQHLQILVAHKRCCLSLKSLPAAAVKSGVLDCWSLLLRAVSDRKKERMNKQTNK